MSNVSLPRGDIPIGYATVNGFRVPVIVDMEWMRAFWAMLTRIGGVSAPDLDLAALLTSLNAKPVLFTDASDEGAWAMPGPRGADGLRGADGAAIWAQDGEPGEPGIPGPRGEAGQQGPSGVPMWGQDGEHGDPGIPGGKGETGQQGLPGFPIWGDEGEAGEPGMTAGNSPGAPSASVGLTAVTGASPMFMRADGAPALSVAISPTWTGVHTFQPSAGVKLLDAQITSAGAAVYARIANGSNAAGSAAVLSMDPSSNGFGVRDGQIRATNNGSNAITVAILTANGGAPTSKLEVSPAGQVSVMVGGRGLSVAEGSNAKQGTATLVAGTVTVSNTSVTANSRIFISRSTPGGTLGDLSYTKIASTSFTVLSSNVLETSSFDYFITEPS